MIFVPTEHAISSPFGPRRATVPDSSGARPLRQHQGVDFPGAIGDPIVAIADGIVEAATPNGAQGFNCYGHVVVIRHPGFGELRSLSAHLSRVDVRTNQRVMAGDVIGRLGNTNGSVWAPGTTFADGDCNSRTRTTTPRSRAPRAHLHFELREGRYPARYDAPRLDPIAWLTAHGLPYTDNARGGRPVRRSTALPGPGSTSGDGSSEDSGGQGEGPPGRSLASLGGPIALLLVLLAASR